MHIQRFNTQGYGGCRPPDRGWYSLLRSSINRVCTFVFSPASFRNIDFPWWFHRFPRLGLLGTVGIACLGGAVGQVGDLQSVELSWNDSPDTNVVAYNVYFGTQSGQYGSPISFGDVSDVTIPGFEQGMTYYFAVSAVDAEGNESILSNEAIYTVPTTGARPPGPVHEAEFRVGRHAILNDGTVTFNLDDATHDLFSSEADFFESGANLVDQGLRGGSKEPALASSAERKAKESPGINGTSTVSPLPAPMVLQTQIIPDENGQPYELEISTDSAVSGSWEMDASTDLQNWIYYTSGTGCGNGDGHDVDVCIPIDAWVPRMFFRVIRD